MSKNEISVLDLINPEKLWPRVRMLELEIGRPKNKKGQAIRLVQFGPGRGLEWHIGSMQIPETAAACIYAEHLRAFLFKNCEEIPCEDGKVCPCLSAEELVKACEAEVNKMKEDKKESRECGSCGHLYTPTFYGLTEKCCPACGWDVEKQRYEDDPDRLPVEWEENNKAPLPEVGDVIVIDSLITRVVDIGAIHVWVRNFDDKLTGIKKEKFPTYSKATPAEVLEALGMESKETYWEKVAIQNYDGMIKWACKVKELEAHLEGARTWQERNLSRALKAESELAELKGEGKKSFHNDLADMIVEHAEAEASERLRLISAWNDKELYGPAIKRLEEKDTLCKYAERCDKYHGGRAGIALQCWKTCKIKACGVFQGYSLEDEQIKKDAKPCETCGDTEEILCDKMCGICRFAGSCEHKEAMFAVSIPCPDCKPSEGFNCEKCGKRLTFVGFSRLTKEGEVLDKGYRPCSCKGVEND